MNGKVWRSSRAGTAMALLVVTSAAAQSTAVGLSTVRSQRFRNENQLGIFTPQAGDWLGWSLAAGDFNGDGTTDLVAGSPGDNGSSLHPVNDSGSVVARYGFRGRGLPDDRFAVVLRQTQPLDPAEVGDGYGEVVAACDFNGDGAADLAVGIPGEDHLGEAEAGGLQVHYGVPSGLPATGDTFLTQSSPGMPGEVEGGDGVAMTLACGDFDGDSFADLAVGMPNEDPDTGPPQFAFGRGRVDIVPGSPNGLDPGLAFDIDQDSPGIGGASEDKDGFGSAMAVGDFNADGLADLAVSAPGEDDDRGRIHVIFGSPSGLTGEGSLFWDETFVGAVSEAGESFGSELAAGDFDGDGFDDLVVGTPLEDLGFDDVATDAGQVIVLFGASVAFDLNRTQLLSEDALYGPGASEASDLFGYSLASGDFDRDGFADLAIGHPLEAIVAHGDGAVTVVMGSSAGLKFSRRQTVAAGAAGFPGDGAQPGERFGAALAAGDFDGDGHDDLAIGAPLEDEAGIANVGAVTVLYGSLFADGFESGNTSFWSQGFFSPASTRLEVTTAAKLGPSSAVSTSKTGLAVTMVPGSRFLPPQPAYVRVGTDRAFADERVVKGSFFVNPQGLSVASSPQANAFQMVAFTDGPAFNRAGGNARVAFDLVRTAPTGDWALVANHFDEQVGALRFSGSGVLAPVGDPNGRNLKIDFEWSAGSPGHLTVWRTRFVNGAPDATGKVQLFSVDLPGMTNAVVNNVFAGRLTTRDLGASGVLYLDEFSFRR
jgi:hypothetical protein